LAERIAGVSLSKLRYRDDVAGVSFGNFLERLSLHHVERTESFVRALCDVVNSRVGLNVSGENLEDIDAAGERIGDGLEHQRRERSDVFLLALDLLIAVGTRMTLDRSEFIRRGSQLNN